MESTDQVMHLLEILSLETGIDQRYASSSTHYTFVTEVTLSTHISSGGSTTSSTPCTHSTGPTTTPQAAATTTSSGTVLESRRLFSDYHAPVQYRAKISNRPCTAQRICSLPKCFRMQSKLICRKNETNMPTYKLNRMREMRMAAIIVAMSPP